MATGASYLCAVTLPPLGDTSLNFGPVGALRDGTFFCQKRSVLEWQIYGCNGDLALFAWYAFPLWPAGVHGGTYVIERLFAPFTD
jgi:hypothetical protein